MSDLTTWIRAAGIRALKTFAQALLATIGVAGATAGLGDIDWIASLSVGALAAIVSLLTSCAGIPEVDGGANLERIVNAPGIEYDDAMPTDDDSDSDLPADPDPPHDDTE
ncbi:phage holin [Bifidobacterium animalis subsp. animalis]|uniref:holin n=1 Tax=Bifidobacterium animalis TaxID=28025 RepID=UPI001020211A|nr:holin [Bifidobacterium animalis]RYN13509.1 phage holin [Bifidobacterium animalis subsp. animalis]